MKIKLLTKAVTLVALFSLFFGLVGCGEKTEYSGEIVSVSTSCGHMDFSCSYSFYVVKKGERWLLSADCATDSESERIQLEDCPILEEDAKKLLSVLEASGEVSSLKGYREPKLKIFVSDETTYSSAVGFSNGETLFAKTKMSDEIVDYFYRLSKKYNKNEKN